MKVKIIATEFLEGWGYDVRVIDKTATVYDYMSALNSFILEAKGIQRSRIVGVSISGCEGCPTCCMERVPLTSVDYFQLGMEDIVAFVREYCYVTAKGPEVDIMIASQGQNKCQWLDVSTNKCKIYLQRSFVCQTYICCPQSERAKMLRSAIVNQGEDELVRLWLYESFERHLPVHFDEVYCPDVDLNDWQANPFTGKRSYNEVLLVDLLTEEEWILMTKEHCDNG